MLENLKAYLAKRLPSATFDVEVIKPEEPFVLEWPSDVTPDRFPKTDGETRFVICLPVDEYEESRARIAYGALRHATPSVEPRFVPAVFAVIVIPDNASQVQAMRDRGNFSWSWNQWRNLDEETYATIHDTLVSREAATRKSNWQNGDTARAHPANIHAQAQIGRQKAILENLPTEEVDRYLAEIMGYSFDRQAGWGKSTRRNFRKQARQQMTKEGYGT